MKCILSSLRFIHHSDSYTSVSLIAQFVEAKEYQHLSSLIVFV